MTVTFRGVSYQCVLGSDLDRDGMYLELSEVVTGEIVAEIFYSDQTHQMVLNAFKKALPLELVEWLVGQAKTDLPPVTRPE
jgi:hypothetical protein